MKMLFAAIEASSLAPALITASVAILTFVANQWLLVINKRSELLREKLDKLWLALLVISRQTRPITAYGDKLDEEIARNLHERAHLLIDSTLEPTTYIALYFPSLKCRYSRVTKACLELSEVMRKPPLPRQGGGPSGGASLVSTCIAMMHEPGFFKELTDASERAKTEVGDLQVYMRENQAQLTKTLLGMIEDRW